MRIETCELDGVLRIVPEVFEDHRGRYVELFDTEKYREVCGEREFVQDDISVSGARVLRGLHGDWRTTKLVSVLQGRGYAVIADNRPDSPTWHRWQAFELSGDNRVQLLLPPGLGNSILACDGPLVYWYKQDTHFVPGQQFTIRWNDPEWGFHWPIDDPILSDRDREGSYVAATS
ncbi:MAG: dTDP-4-dehydrorhamnose 3,5-epimerase family protein [Planctomycetes bacterium]|nr:dTDP-4-dehydrorhamnose 3,5-epimerase family protein [Planctomycetota bacterium]